MYENSGLGVRKLRNTQYRSNTAEGWDQLPERARVEVLSLLARLIARGVFEEDAEAGDG